MIWPFIQVDLRSRMSSPFWILLELRTMEVVNGDNWSYKMYKAQVKSYPPTKR